MTKPDATPNEVEACHHMRRSLERTVEGTAGPLTKAAVNVHTLSCAACRTRLAQLRAVPHEPR